jgi:hypothetical protein
MVPQLLQTPERSPNGAIGLFSGDSDGGLLSPDDFWHFDASASTNLVDWEVLTNSLTLTNGLLWLLDDSATNESQRFYRVLERP